MLRPPPTSAQRALAPCWVVIAVTVAVALWFCSLCAMERSRSGACITTRDAKHSASYQAHTCGLRGTGNGRLASPVGLGSHVGCPSLERSRTAPPDPPLLPFPLVISHLTSPPRTGLWGRDSPLPVTSPPQLGDSAAACKADLGLSLEETCGSADATDLHPACSRLHSTRGLSCPHAFHLE